MTSTAGGAGLGLRRPLLANIIEADAGDFDFLEVAPENWIGVGGLQGERFEEAVKRHPLFLHGLSLNLGGVNPLDMGFVAAVGEFMRRYKCPLYSEHLTACQDHGQLYDLLPLPFTRKVLRRVVDRIRAVQDALGFRIAIENASYYAALEREMDERDFLCEALEGADCELLLDINNIVVNGVNHVYDAEEYLDALPAERVRYFHIAGHAREDVDLRVDTHGADVPEAAWALLERAYRRFGAKPTLLERDFEFPGFDNLLGEVTRIRELQSAAA